MKVFDPKLLQKWTKGSWTKKPYKPIVNFCFDTRLLKENECFLAIKNNHNDGHSFVNSAKNNGASSVILEHEIEDCSLPQLIVNNTLEAFQAIAKNYRKTIKTHIIGITGSCGKTTFREILALLLGPCTFKTSDNFNNHLGVPYSITHIDPDKHNNAVIEVGISSASEMDILSDIISPDDAIIINVAPAHLQNFQSLDAIAYEKFKLLNYSRNNSFFPENLSSFNLKKQGYYKFINEEYRDLENVINYQLALIESGWNISVQNYEFKLPHPCGDGVANSFAMAIGYALIRGISFTEIQERLLKWEPFQKRGVWRHKDGKHYFIDCYNANPIAFTDSFQHFYRTRPNKTFTTCYCIGSMMELGELSKKSHENLAKNIQISPNDIFICIGDFKDSIAKGLLKQGANIKQIQTFNNTEEASVFFKKTKADCIYLKGSHCYHLENLVAE